MTHPVRYRIHLSGRLGPAARAGFEGLDIDESLPGETVVCGDLDQAGLFGVLARVQALTIALLEVRLDRSIEQ